jgi:hypothetical protein
MSMAGETAGVPPEIARDAGGLIAALQAGGWIVRGFNCHAKIMGNWRFEIAREGRVLQLVKDRSQYYVIGLPEAELKPAGLWKVFDDFAKFHKAIVNWALRPQV